jgi:hypothetical protein
MAGNAVAQRDAQDMAKSKPPRRKARKRSPASNLVALKAQVKERLAVKDHAGMLALLRPLMAAGIGNEQVFHDAAIAALALEKYADAAGYARKAIALSPNAFTHYDALSHAAGGMRDWDTVQTAGYTALSLRDAAVPDRPPVDFPLATPSPDASLDIISFSLFGGNSKYCETAVLNCEEQPEIYPNWRCRFHVDDTVPADILQRIRQAGGDVTFVSPAMLDWPAPMWRFAALDDPHVRRVIFRDADSVISSREAGAVAEWIAEGQAFHAMRDSGSHTELLLAGLWGAKAGALPSMHALISDFLRASVANAHFADQLFLRNYVWPYARRDILQHDSLFGFGKARPFPEGPHRDDFHTGYAEGSPVLNISTRQPEGRKVHWYLVDRRVTPHRLICRYPAFVAQGHVTANIPARFARLIPTGEVSAHVELPLETSAE